MPSSLVLVTLTAACLLGSAVAQFGQRGFLGQFAALGGSEWLMDDPHKADRMPVWGQLLGNRGYRTRSRGRTGTNARGASGIASWNSFGGNINWMPFLMNFDN